MSSRELNKQQIKALGLEEAVSKKEIFNGLAEIAAYTGKSISSIRRAIKRGSLIGSNGGTRNGKYITSRQNIDIWIARTQIEMMQDQPVTKRQETIRTKLYEHMANRERNT